MPDVPFPRPALARFAFEDRGAIAVEWVVLAAGVTAMGIAALNAERAALAGFWNRMHGEVSAQTQHHDFSDGAAGWTGATVANIPGFGSALGPIGGSGGLETVSRTFEFPEGRERATISFDLYGLDSLDHEEAVFYVNGREVGRVRATPGTTSSTEGDAEGVTFTGEMIDGRAQLGGMRDGDEVRWHDSITRVEITLDRPDRIVTLGMGSTADSHVSDESFALDNVTVTGAKAGT